MTGDGGRLFGAWLLGVGATGRSPRRSLRSQILRSLRSQILRSLRSQILRSLRSQILRSLRSQILRSLRSLRMTGGGCAFAICVSSVSKRRMLTNLPRHHLLRDHYLTALTQLRPHRSTTTRCRKILPKTDCIRASPCALRPVRSGCDFSSAQVLFLRIVHCVARQAGTVHAGYCLTADAATIYSARPAQAQSTRQHTAKNRGTSWRVKVAPRSARIPGPHSAHLPLSAERPAWEAAG